MSLTLTQGQQAAYEAFSRFIMDPTEQVFVIEGFSGTGKSTLVKTLIEQLPNIMKAVRLIHPSMVEREVHLTATTNKACEALAGLSHQPVVTIHSFLGLRVNQDFRTGETTLVPRNNDIRHDCIVFIDEASYIDPTLLELIFKRTKHCKIIFMGDPAQITPVKYNFTPVFQAKFPTARLTEVVRNDGLILEVSTMFRKTVETGEFFSFTPDGQAIQYLQRGDFDQAILDEFNRPDWKHNDSKVLAWTNKTVINYNHGISAHVTGNPEFQIGDYGIVNRYMNFQGGGLKTDETVIVSHVGPDTYEHGVLGNFIEVNNRWNVFLPKDLADKKKAIKEARDQGAINQVAHIENNWIDLRAAYACTINKAQGSTYKRVFIDLDDIKKCNSGNQIARMMYVAVSRASDQVFLTGDLV
jgi:hypothetical protein